MVTPEFAQADLEVVKIAESLLAVFDEAIDVEIFFLMCLLGLV